MSVSRIDPAGDCVLGEIQARIERITALCMNGYLGARRFHSQHVNERESGGQLGDASGRYFVTINNLVLGTTQMDKIDLEDRSDALSRSMGVGSEM